MSSPSLTFALWKVLAHDNTVDAGITLLGHLLRNGEVNWADQIETRNLPRAGKTEGDVDLEQSLLAAYPPGHYAPKFHTAEIAQALVELRPGIFSSRLANGQCWAWHTLKGWAQNTDRIRLGFDGETADAWAAAMIGSLSDSVRAEPAAQEIWPLLLAMGMPRACTAFAQGRLSKWLERDDKGQLFLKRARGTGLWQAALAAGVDPFAEGPNKTPLWRELLPKNSQSLPEKDSVRCAVEQWINVHLETQRIGQAHADPRTAEQLPLMVNQRAQWLSKALTEFFREGRAASPSWLPSYGPEWLDTQPFDPPWARPFLAQGQKLDIIRERWAQTLDRLPEWRQRTGAVGHIVLRLFQNPDVQALSAKEWAHAASAGNAGHSLLVRLAEAQVWGPKGPSAGAILARLEHHRLDRALGVSPVAAHRPRL